MKLKRIVIASTLLLMSAINPVISYADGTDLDLKPGKIDDLGNPMPKSPIQPPSVSLDDNTLYFNSAHPGYILTLFDEDGVIAYQTFVPADVNVVILPTTLTGDFELRLYSDGSYYFYGFISQWSK